MFLLQIRPFCNINSNFLCCFSTKHQGNEALKLYKHLLKQCQKLPKGPKEHYNFMIKQSFKQYVSETDQTRIDEIIKRSYEDCDWVLKKYLGK